ncbi:MAG: DNA replication/repair protein RecF [Magnetovibrionaceae bacterium]
MGLKFGPMEGEITFVSTDQMTENKDASVVGRKAAQPLALDRLVLTDFRCYPTAKLAGITAEGVQPVVLCGPNGAGKTNLLEALSLLAPGRGLRRAALGDFARIQGAGGWAVAASVVGALGEAEIGTGLTAGAPEGERRAVRIDGEAASSQQALAERFSVQWLTPQMDRLFLEGPSARRRFLDRMVFGIDPAHSGRVSAYEKAMRDRARVLRENQRPDAHWLDALEAGMAERGVAISAARRDMLDRLAGELERGFGPFPAARVALDGLVDDWVGSMPALEAEDRLKAALKDSRRRDAETGSTAIGPHRTDLLVHHLAKDMAADQCSTGEQKALLIALVLGHVRLTAADRGCVPVLLLDEVAAHLDQARREALFEALLALGTQAWLTGTDQPLFEPLRGKAQFFEITDAAVSRA